MESQRKIHHFNDGTTSCFKYEELTEDWLDLTVVDTSKQRPALKNRLHGNAAKYKPLLSREALRAEDGVEYFWDKLRHHFVKRAYSVFLWRFYQFNLAKRGSVEMVKWIGKFSLLLKRQLHSLIWVVPEFSHLHLQKHKHDLVGQEVYRHHLHQVLVSGLGTRISNLLKQKIHVSSGEQTAHAFLG